MAPAWIKRSTSARPPPASDTLAALAAAAAVVFGFLEAACAGAFRFLLELIPASDGKEQILMQSPDSYIGRFALMPTAFMSTCTLCSDCSCGRLSNNC